MNLLDLHNLIGEQSFWDLHKEQIIIIALLIVFVVAVYLLIERKAIMRGVIQRKQLKTNRILDKTTRIVVLHGIDSSRVIVGDSFSPPLPTRDGYSFGGWYVDTALTVPWLSSQPVINNVTLYPKWNKL